MNGTIQNPDYIKNKLFNKIIDIFKKNLIRISEQQLDNIFGLINNKVSEKAFTGALLQIDQNYKFDNDNENIINNENINLNENENSFEEKKKFFEIKSKNKDNKQEILDYFFDNNNSNNNINKENEKGKEKEKNNLLININQQNELTDNRDLSELKSNTINNNEPKKSKGFCVKQFSFEDFVLNKNGNLNDH